MQKRTRLIALVYLFLLAVPALQAVLSRSASAAQITSRSLTLQAGADPILNGGSRAGATGVKHFFSFTLPTTGSVGSIQFKYCTLPNGPGVACNTPIGLSTTSASLGAETGATGFSIVNATNGSPYLTRTAAGITGPQAVSYRLDGITNPDGTSCGLPSPATPNCTFFVWVSTFASIDTTGSATDTGTVTASTATQITLTGTMPESLVFCTGGTISTTGGVPDCATASSGAISFNKLFSPTDTSTTSSQMAASTNAGSGYVITVNGPTLTSGSNTITGISTAAAGVHGVSQFGLNLKANTTTTSNPAVGAEVAPAANGTNYRGQAYINGGTTTNYGTVDTFQFRTGDTVANSGNGGLGGTDAQIFTTSYIVNVPGSQPAGTYTTTLTYICTPTF
jgi:hypothetical protein